MMSLWELEVPEILKSVTGANGEKSDGNGIKEKRNGISMQRRIKEQSNATRDGCENSNKLLDFLKLIEKTKISSKMYTSKTENILGI